MICPNCGTENPPDAHFCTQCGAPLTAGKAEWPLPPSPPMPPASEVSEPALWGQPYPSAPAAPARPISVPRRFPILRVLSVIYKVLGGIAAAVTLLMLIGTCIVALAGGAMPAEWEQELGIPPVSPIILGLISGLITLISGGLAAIALYAAGEFIALLVALEENTRTIIASLS